MAVLEAKAMEEHLTEETDHHLEMSMDTVVKLSVCMGQLLSSQRPIQMSVGSLLPH